MIRVFNFRPIVAVLLSIVCGICCFLMLSEAYYVLSAVILPLPVICFFVYALIRKKFGYKIVVFALVCQIIALFGFFSVYISFNSSFYSGNDVCAVSGRYVGKELYGNSFVYYFDDCSFTFNGNDISSAKLDVTAISSEDSDTVTLYNAVYGNVYTFTAVLSAESKYSSGGKLNRKAFTERRFFGARSDFSDITQCDVKLSFTEKILFKARETLFNGMGKDEAALTYAMLFGDTSEIDRGLLENIRFSGVAHIFAVSGLHIGIVSSAVMLLFDKLKANKYISCLFTLAFSFFYCAICGYTSSSLRAFIMFAVLNAAKLTGRKNDLMNTVSLSALILLTVKPCELFSPGFLLSYGAVYGICLLTPSLKRIFSFLPESIREAVSVSLAAQTGSLPASVCFFGNVPMIALLLNLLILPLISVLFIADVIAVALGAITSLPEICLYVPDKITSFFTAFMRDIDFSSFSLGGNLSWFVFPLCAAGIVFASDKCNLGYKTKALLFTVCFGFSMIFSQITAFISV
ncbi:MAG: ComEC/Rec2 family competence protein [bacterium]|nr:ComEC/Rec2 family competence protein [bacterium]